MDYQKQLEVDSLIVADCAIYSESNLKLMSNLRWLCRVTLSIKSAQTLISTLPESEFITSSVAGYKFRETTVTYAGIEQRWLVVESAARKESDLRKLSQKIVKAEAQAIKDVHKLSKDKFACEADAIKAISKLAKSFKYHQIEQYQVTEVTANEPDNQPERFYQIAATVSRNETKINTETKSAGRFIIATNVLDSRVLSNDEMLSEYKAQQSCERGFGFLKDPLFLLIVSFLKVQRELNY